MSQLQILLDLLLISLSSSRITRLITTDSIMQPVRDNFIVLEEDLYVPKNKFGELIHCNWCMGFWVTVIMVTCYYNGLPQIIFIILSAAYLQGLFNSKEG